MLVQFLQTSESMCAILVNEMFNQMTQASECEAAGAGQLGEPLLLRFEILRLKTSTLESIHRSPVLMRLVGMETSPA